MKFKNITKGIIYSSALTAGVICFTEVAFAAFDLDQGVKASTDSIMSLITKYYGYGLVIGASGGAVVGQGDLRDRSINAGKGIIVASGLMFALLKAVS